MSFVKWIGAAVGWSFGGPIGAIIGLAIGNMIDKSNDSPLLGQGSKKSRPNYKERKRTTRREKPKTESGDFEISLLILSSIIIKADGKQDKRELDFVRDHFQKMYGTARANQAFNLFKNINKQKISTRQVATQIRQMMDHASRLQLLHFLFGIAKADGLVTDDELHQIEIINGYLGISHRDFESIKAMFYNSSANAYKILEIEKTVSDDEVKKSYRKMAKKYHPDRVVHLGEEHRKNAEEMFRKVQEAYEHIQLERGFK